MEADWHVLFACKQFAEKKKKKKKGKKFFFLTFLTPFSIVAQLASSLQHCGLKDTAIEYVKKSILASNAANDHTTNKSSLAYLASWTGTTRTMSGKIENIEETTKSIGKAPQKQEEEEAEDWDTELGVESNDRTTLSLPLESKKYAFVK